MTRVTTPIRSDERPRRRPGPISLLLLIATATTLLFAVSSAWASSGIEGVWEFESGQIAIEQQSGALVGVVVEETKLKECVHPVGQRIWTELMPQPDGSYWGLHQWYFEGCAENPERGRTALRVLDEPNGSKYLLVCLSYPGGSEPQPTIAANGSDEYASYGCIKSKLTAALPSSPGSGSPGSSSGGSSSGGSNSGGSSPGSGSSESSEVERLSLPSAKKCLSARLFQIRLAEPKYDPFKTVLVTIDGHKIATAHHGRYVVASIKLGGLEHGEFTVKIHARTVLGHHLSSSRTYRKCTTGTQKSKPIKLH